MGGQMMVATVAGLSPLRVRLKGAVSDTVVQWAPVGLVPVGLAVGQRCAVAVIDRQVWFFGRADVAP